LLAVQFHFHIDGQSEKRYTGDKEEMNYLHLA
jgi:hypothetical protein